MGDPILNILINNYPNFANNGKIAEEIWKYVDSNYMQWKPIIENNLPDECVLAANFKPYTYGYQEKLVSYLGRNEEGIYCDSEYEILENCTHYIELDKYDR